MRHLHYLLIAAILTMECIGMATSKPIDGYYV
jgi:hypothetical protein